MELDILFVIAIVAIMFVLLCKNNTVKETMQNVGPNQDAGGQGGPGGPEEEEMMMQQMQEEKGPGGAGGQEEEEYQQMMQQYMMNRQQEEEMGMQEQEMQQRVQQAQAWQMQEEEMQMREEEESGLPRIAIRNWVHNDVIDTEQSTNSAEQTVVFEKCTTNVRPIMSFQVPNDMISMVDITFTTKIQFTSFTNPTTSNTSAYITLDDTPIMEVNSNVQPTSGNPVDRSINFTNLTIANIANVEPGTIHTLGLALCPSGLDMNLGVNVRNTVVTLKFRTFSAPEEEVKMEEEEQVPDNIVAEDNICLGNQCVGSNLWSRMVEMGANSNNNQLCINGTCLSENHLKKIIGQDSFKLTAKSNNKRLKRLADDTVKFMSSTGENNDYQFFLH